MSPKESQFKVKTKALNGKQQNDFKKVQAMTGVDMTEEQKVEYFKKLHRNYKKGNQNQSGVISKSEYSSKTPNQSQKIKFSKSDTGSMS